MFTVKVSIKDETAKMAKAVEKYNIESLGHAGGILRKTAQRSIRRRTGPSRPGTPPNTHSGALRRSIRYAVDKQREEVRIGPVASVIGTRLGPLHEFGGKNKRGTYPARPFMGPAFKTILPRLPDQWRKSVIGG